MALSWTDIFPDVDGEPVRASLDEVDGVATMFERMGDASQRILDEFEQVTSDAGTGSLEGDAADAFRDIVDKVAGSLGDLPAVCDDAHGALADHLSRLGDLRSEAASALARARTRWEAHEDAVRTLSSRRSSHDQATADLDSLPPAGADPAADADRTAAGGRCRAERPSARRRRGRRRLGGRRPARQPRGVGSACAATKTS